MNNFNPSQNTGNYNNTMNSSNVGNHPQAMYGGGSPDVAFNNRSMLPGGHSSMGVSSGGIGNWNDDHSQDDSMSGMSINSRQQTMLGGRNSNINGGNGMLVDQYQVHQHQSSTTGYRHPSPSSSMMPPSPPVMSMSPQQSHHLGMNSMSPSPTLDQPNVIFIGDLSFFCREQHLIELFSQFGRVVKCSIVLNDAHTKSLMYGFVTMSTHEEAATVAERFNNQLFMGRTMK